MRKVQIEHHRPVGERSGPADAYQETALTVLETALYAEDLDAAAHFYAEVLGLTSFMRERGRHVFFRAGGSLVLLFNPASTATLPTFVGGSAIPLHGARGPGHVAFAVAEADLTMWRDRLGRAGVPIEAEVRWPSGGRSIYVRDPAGNSVELATRSVWAGHL